MARSPHGRKLDEVLADGEWHDREALIEAMIVVVPPGHAYRTAEQHRQRQRGRKQPRARGDESTAVLAGKRRLCRDAIGSRVYEGTAERRQVAGCVQIRRRP